MAKKSDAEKKHRPETVSLHPLEPKEALADLMKVKPEPKTSKGRRARPKEPEHST